MGLFSLPFQLPALPVKAFLSLANVLREQAEQELYDPAAVRRRLEEVAEAHAEGTASDEEVERAQSEAVGRLVRPAPPRAAEVGPDEEG